MPVSNTQDAPEPARGLLAGLFQPSENDDTVTRPRMPAPLSQVELAGGAVVVGGPDGYCVDPTSLQSRPARGFAVIASCQILSGGRVGQTVDPMLVTVTVGPRSEEADLPSPEEFARAAQSSLISGASRNGLVLAHLQNGGATALQGGDPRYWRAAFLQGPYLVGLALYAPEGSALAGDDGGVRLVEVQRLIAQKSLGGQDQRAPAGLQGTTALGRLFGR